MVSTTLYKYLKPAFDLSTKCRLKSLEKKIAPELKGLSS